MRLTALLLSLALLAACSSSGPIHEPTPLEPLASDVRVQSLWSARTPSGREDEIYGGLHPLIDGDTLYTIGAEGVVQAHRLDSGKRRWRVELETVVSAGLGQGGDLLLLGSAKGEVLALARDSGEVRWRSRVSSEVLAAPVAANGVAIVRSGNGVTEALSLEDGRQLWQYSSSVPSLSLRGEAAPVVSDDLVLLGLANGSLVALSVFDGTLQWEAVIGMPQGRTDLERMVDVDATPRVLGDVVYAIAHQGRVMALSRLTGASLWQREIGGSAGLALDEHHLYVVDDESRVWALDRRSGATLWQSEQLLYRELGAPLAHQGAVIVGDFEGYLHWLSSNDGAIIARHRLDEDGIFVAPLARDEVIFSRSRTGKVEALRLRP